MRRSLCIGRFRSCASLDADEKIERGTGVLLLAEITPPASDSGVQSAAVRVINGREVQMSVNHHVGVDPEIELVEHGGEVSLLFDGRQAMQAWERDLMFAS